ncbi:MAG: hypothetical protein RMZ69_17630 [Nostoc sp. ChiQUE01a]|nr:hypothetical protein [Nostoc sp. ChiQUE01a]
MLTDREMTSKGEILAANPSFCTDAINHHFCTDAINRVSTANSALYQPPSWLGRLYCL